MFEDIKRKYEVKERKLVYSYKDGYLGKNRYKVRLNNGKEFYTEELTKGNRVGDAVVIIPITEDNKYILVIESRPNTKEGVAISFPAGMVDDGEDYLESAKRELEEETGYIADEYIELESHYQDQGCSRAIIKTYLAVNCKKVSNQKLDVNENITPIIVTLDELNELYESNEFKDANTKIAYMTYALRKGK